MDEYNPQFEEQKTDAANTNPPTFEQPGVTGNSQINYVTFIPYGFTPKTYEEKNGNLLAETYGNGYVYQYTYDDMDRMTGKETLRWYEISGKTWEKKPSRPDVFMTCQEDLSITGTTGTRTIGLPMT